MTASLFLALLFGTYIIAVSIPMIFDVDRMQAIMKEMVASQAIVFLAGLLALISGVSVLAFHNIWTADWRVIITILGWVALAEGAILLIAPKFLVRVASAFLDKRNLIRPLGLLYLAFGAFLLSRFYG